MAVVKPRGWFIDGGDHDQSRGDRLTCDHSRSEGVRESPACPGRRAARPGRRPGGRSRPCRRDTRACPGRAEGCCCALHRTHGQAGVAHHAQATRDHERTRRVHPLCGDRLTTQPAVELVSAASKRRELVIGTQTLEAQIAGAQRRGRGSLRSSATSSGARPLTARPERHRTNRTSRWATSPCARPQPALQSPAPRYGADGLCPGELRPCPGLSLSGHGPDTASRIGALAGLTSAHRRASARRHSPERPPDFSSSATEAISAPRCTPLTMS